MKPSSSVIKNPYRFEFKYYLSEWTAEALQTLVQKAGLVQDAYAAYPDGSYDVTSLYYDAFDFFDFDEKAGGFQKRKKVRLRIYEPFLERSEYGFLEIKEKFGMTNRKIKIKMDRQQMDAFFHEGKASLLKYPWKNEEVKNAIMSHLIERSVKPAAFVTYRRTAYMSSDKALRITFDRALKASDQRDLYRGKPLAEVMPPQELVMEVKYQHVLPIWLKHAMIRHSLSRQTYSKYEHSLIVLKRFCPIPR